MWLVPLWNSRWLFSKIFDVNIFCPWERDDNYLLVHLPLCLLQHSSITNQNFVVSFYSENRSISMFAIGNSISDIWEKLIGQRFSPNWFERFTVWRRNIISESINPKMRGSNVGYKCTFCSINHSKQPVSKICSN